MSKERGSTKPRPVDILAIIAMQLERIADTLETVAKANDEEETRPVSQNESIGSCPDCSSMEVTQDGELPKAIFNCKGCGMIWINNPNEFFGVR